MFQHKAKKVGSCLLYVKVGMFTHLEPSKISLLLVNKTEIVRLTVQMT